MDKRKHYKYPTLHTHDLLKLLADCSVEVQPEEIDFLVIVNSWKIRGRYPDYSNSLHKASTEKYTALHMEKVLNLQKWLA